MIYGWPGCEMMRVRVNAWMEMYHKTNENMAMKIQKHEMIG
jgi:hypothetical protein